MLEGVLVASPGQASVPAGQAPLVSTLFTFSNEIPPRTPHRYFPSKTTVDLGAMEGKFMRPLTIALEPGHVYLNRSISVFGSQASDLTLMSTMGRVYQS